MKLDKVLVIGAGIGGLTVAIALRRKGFAVDMIERDPEWGIYGVGITQQFNVIRAMASLDLLDAYLEQAQGFDRTTLFGPDGSLMTSFEIPRPVRPRRRVPTTGRTADRTFQKDCCGSGAAHWADPTLYGCRHGDGFERRMADERGDVHTFLGWDQTHRAGFDISDSVGGRRLFLFPDSRAGFHSLAEDFCP